MAIKKVAIPDVGNVYLYKRRGVKSLRLSITSKGEIRVSLPYWLPYSVAEQFAFKKRDWILSHKLSSAKPLQQGGRIGKAHRIIFVPELNRNTVASRVVGSEIRVRHPIGLSHSSQDVQKVAEKASVRALKTQAEKLLPERLETLASRHDFEYQSVVIKRLTSRWGSCSSDGVIALSCFLMQLPWHLIDYVLLHELAHTRVMAHGPNFWREVEQYLPNARELRKEIKDYRPILFTLD